MKKHSRMLAAALLGICLVMSGCGGEDNKDNESSKSESSAAESSAASVSQPKPKENSNKSKTPAPDSWKVIYIQKLNDYFREMMEYDVPDGAFFELIDINKDKTPELIISSPSFHDAKCEVYTAYKGKLVDLKVDAGYEKLFYKEELKQIATKSISDGVTNIWAAELEDGKLKQAVKAVGDFGNYKFTVNGKDVTEYEFYEATANYNDFGDVPWVQLGKKTPFEAEKITEVVNSWKE